MPALGFEIGQFRHGPLELLSPDLGVVLFCGDEADRAAVREPGAGDGRCRLARRRLRLQRRRAGRRAQSMSPFRRARISRPFLLILPALQRLIISIAARKVDRVGEPIRSTKITREAS